jgi:hypothetical protein
MASISRNFIAGKMNKIVDQRLIPEGEYVDAMNIRMGSTENSEVGVIENTKGNLELTTLVYNGHLLSTDARCIGAVQDSANETIYWFVHDPSFTYTTTGKIDLIVSFNIITNILTYHVISINDGTNVTTTLNFNPTYLITGINILNNLLFFTDDYNPPRFINIGRNYPNPIAGVDKVSAESLLVIKKPPTEAPTIVPFVTNGQENYLDTRFICFAYRYKYIDGEYSATSQWTAPAFIPKAFQFDLTSYLNEGMTNFCNAVKVTYNSGGPLVVGVDLLFKQSENYVIKIIEQLNKANSGLADNTNYTYVFQNSKIFTILPTSELLRLFDNVPRLAKAQTLMGNRLMYGNYVDGYDLIDKDGVPVRFNYSINTVSNAIGSTTLTNTFSSGNYSINGAVTIADSIISLDLTGLELKNGSSINLSVTLSHDRFTGQTPYPTITSQNITFSLAFILAKDYSSVYQFATSPEFQDAIFTLPLLSVANSCLGTTFTDSFNCEIPAVLGVDYKLASGITAINQPITIITSPASSSIGFQFPAMQFVNNVTTPTQTFYEYYKVVAANSIFQEIANSQSLHSNRDYEVGIVYMDEFNRSTTALVSPTNTVHIPCGSSDTQNLLQVTIPITQHPPSWATRYKFVIKPSQENYEVIYCSLFFQDPNSNNVYFLLEGENAQKIQTGDRLIVKADSGGPTSSCTYATVLEKASQAAGFLEIVNPLDTTLKIPVPGGVYMKMDPTSFSITQDPLAIVAPGLYDETRYDDGSPGPIVNYPMNTKRKVGYDPTNPTWVYEDYTVPAGSKIHLIFKQDRAGYNNACEKRTSELDKVIVASQDYLNMYDWWVGDNVQRYLNDGVRYAGGNACVPDNKFLSTITNTPNDVLTDICINYYKFYRNTTTNEFTLMVTGTDVCHTAGHYYSRASRVRVDIQVFRSESTLIFETQPLDALPDVFYENELSLPIVNGYHIGNIQNQTSSIPAIIDSHFFNCFAFGNGAESYKIRDSIVGAPFNFGNRVTTVSAQEFKTADRFSDITYSGVYNSESNLNELNVFNLGLLDFKHLETSFGPIYIMDGRQTDILVLQEDKVSYVLANKNLLSDSAGGGAVTSIPEVLGTQIARTEKYGISFNPESYVHWGYNRFFTDTKRGAVIQLRGNSAQNEELRVVSEFNMRTWFRDRFNESFNNQKIGGFDPYMNEYILSLNDIPLPSVTKCVGCGISQTFTLSGLLTETKSKSFCVNLGSTVGVSNINYAITTIEAGAEFEVVVNYNGSSVSSGYVSTNGSISFNKNSISAQTATITVNYIGNVTLSVTPSCPTANQLTLVQVVLTNAFQAGQTVHTQFNYTQGAFVSPVQSAFVPFAAGTTSPLVSRYNIISGPEGTGSFPPVGSEMSLYSNKYSTDTFIFDPLIDKFRYFRSNTLYTNTSTDINTLLSLSTVASPNLGTTDINYASFIVPSTGTYLYAIWDFRNSIGSQLCYSDISVADVCCNCDVTSYPLVMCYSNTSSTNSCCGCTAPPI